MGTPGGGTEGLLGFTLNSVMESADLRGFGAKDLDFKLLLLSSSLSMVLRAVRDFAL